MRHKTKSQRRRGRRGQCRRNKDTQQNWKDEEFERVVEAMQEFFDQRWMNNQSANATMEEIRAFVMGKCHRVGTKKFVFSWTRALRNRYVIEAEGTGRYKMIDGEDHGIPQRMNEFKSMEDELEHLVEAVMQCDATSPFNDKVKDLKCYFCERLFFDVSGLKQHCERSHAKAQGYLYQCEQCPHKFRRKQQLESHHKFEHEDMWDSHDTKEVAEWVNEE